MSKCARGRCWESESKRTPSAAPWRSGCSHRTAIKHSSARDGGGYPLFEHSSARDGGGCPCLEHSSACDRGGGPLFEHSSAPKGWGRARPTAVERPFRGHHFLLRSSRVLARGVPPTVLSSRVLARAIPPSLKALECSKQGPAGREHSHARRTSHGRTTRHPPAERAPGHPVSPRDPSGERHSKSNCAKRGTRTGEPSSVRRRPSGTGHGTSPPIRRVRCPNDERR
ncbi:MAG: hypothetical protein RL033_3801 [Pseudomonadota bacterium]